MIRFRCPRCRRTATVQPADVLAGMHHDLPTVAAIITAYLDHPRGYRELPLHVLDVVLPEGLTPSTLWGQPEAPSPTPSTCFRWVARFVQGALAWWRSAVRHLLRRGVVVSHAAPGHLTAKGRSHEKRQRLQWGWHATVAYQQIAVHLGMASHRWPFVMRHDPAPPSTRDPTEWFCGLPP